MSKEQQYIELAKEIRECHICKNIKAPAYSKDGECLRNDSAWVKFPENASVSDVYVNRWNLWHGDLNPHIMVIGQDYGCVKKDDITLASEWHETKPKNWRFTTDTRLYNLFLDNFGFEINKNNPEFPLYFTNVACCYRTKDSTSQANEAWYPICASRYLGRLIKIVRPKMIICLGQIAFNCMGCLEGISFNCTTTETSELKKMSLKKLMDREKYSFSITFDNEEIPVMPVYHPGAKRNRNRSEEEEKKDWKGLKERYDKIMGGA